MNSTMPGKVHRAHRTAVRFVSISVVAAAAAIYTPFALAAAPAESAESTNKLMVVDCLLPGQVRKLGVGATFLTARQAVKTSATDCEIRGGEYVAYDRANYATALKIWLPLANNGDKQAQTYVGEIFEKGLGTTPDYQAAMTWYRRAADQGYSRALVNLGFLYEKGLGVPKDPAAALNLYRRAAGIEGSIALDDDSGTATQRLAEEVSSLQRLLAETRRSLETANADRAKAEAARDSLSRERAEAARRNDTAGINLLEARLAERDKELREQREELQRLQLQAQRLSDELGRTQAARNKQAESETQSAAALSARDLEIRRRDQEILKLSGELTELRGYKVNLEAERRR